ncbi:hypothetical protein EV356DRAFT_536741 [Viridothelium virens]|uniref:Homeobox domain-containing protein n=1 Tax=Viridothelium virens TaxID=1048519 RepID=A0A6A6GW36_VIRVR|nr:hypothetical protein EV356DRAFT_536741 [Viridothelium virens]
MEYSARRDRQNRQTHRPADRPMSANGVPVHPPLPPVSLPYERERPLHYRTQPHPRSNRTPNSPPYQEPPKLPPISTVLEEVSRPSSPPITPSGQSGAASPVKRGSQDYGTDAAPFDALTSKRLKIDSLVGGSTESENSAQSRSADRRSSNLPYRVGTPRPKLPSFGQSFSQYPSPDDRRSSISSSHRTSYPHDPFYGRPSTGYDRPESSRAGRARSRSPPRTHHYQGHQRSPVGPGWAYPPPSTQAPPPAHNSTPSPYHASRPSEPQHAAYYPHQYNNYPEGHHASQQPGLVRNPPIPIQSYGEPPYQYSWAAIPGATGFDPRRRRGNLPREATAMMKKWYHEHLASPYPTEEEKMHFCEKTGLSMSQVGNWFINARRRQPGVRGNRDSMDNQNSQDDNDDV